MSGLDCKVQQRGHLAQQVCLLHRPTVRLKLDPTLPRQKGGLLLTRGCDTDTHINTHLAVVSVSSGSPQQYTLKSWGQQEHLLVSATAGGADEEKRAPWFQVIVCEAHCCILVFKTMLWVNQLDAAPPWYCVLSHIPPWSYWRQYCLQHLWFWCGHIVVCPSLPVSSVSLTI